MYIDNGGAASGGGAQATMQNVASSAVSNALAARMNHAVVAEKMASIDNLRETNKAIKSQVRLNDASTVKALSDAQFSNTSARSVAASIPVKDLEATIARGLQDFSHSASNSIRNASKSEYLKRIYQDFMKTAPTMGDLQREINSKR
jgi:hypothetical protein